jgi:hypothetical protein
LVEALEWTAHPSFNYEGIVQRELPLKELSLEQALGVLRAGESHMGLEGAIREQLQLD